MTDEVIEHIVAEHFGCPVQEAIAAVRDAVSRAYEEAAQAVCVYCKDGQPVEFQKGNVAGK